MLQVAVCECKCLWYGTLVHAHTYEHARTHFGKDHSWYGLWLCDSDDARRRVIIIHMNRRNCMRTPLDNAHAHAQARAEYIIYARVRVICGHGVRARVSILRKCARGFVRDRSHKELCDLHSYLAYINKLECVRVCVYARACQYMLECV